MVVNRPDWCISRQRSWGGAITLITCEDCGTYINDEALFDRITAMTEAEGADIWYAKSIEELLDGPRTCAKCGSAAFKKEMDILDVWFDSGVSHAAVLEPDDRLSWPAYMYLEGSDQHRGWFQSSLLASVGNAGSGAVSLSPDARFYGRRSGQEDVEVTRQCYCTAGDYQAKRRGDYPSLGFGRRLQG